MSKDKCASLGGCEAATKIRSSKQCINMRFSEQVCEFADDSSGSGTGKAEDEQKAAYLGSTS
jgi:hypothetical protein